MAEYLSLSDDVSRVKENIRQFICEELLEQPDFPLTFSDSLIENGLVDSFAIVNLSLYLENHFGVELSEDDLTLENIDSIDRIYRMLVNSSTISSIKF